MENCYFRDLEIGQVRKAVLTVDFNYEEGTKGGFKPVLRNVVVERVKSGKSTRVADLQGFPHAPVSDITLRDCSFDGVAVYERIPGSVIQPPTTTTTTTSTRR